MPETRPSLAPSLSFSGSSSPSTISRPLKRRLTSTSDLTFFTPAATSFKPRPYNPNVAGVQPPKPLPPRNNHIRSVESLALPSPVMDPSPMDPNCVFIHPPFTSFPGSETYPDGLYYPLMAANPEWFLDPSDFISANSTNPNAIPYPPHLEPPRGWCPAKKRDLKERGADGWPEGEEPRLRCTFCRRTYAGVNAKSMWRRHVFEKHKIAMSNRRDTNERPRGRGSNKENRQFLFEGHNDNCHDSILSMNVAPQTMVPVETSYKSKSRSLLPADDLPTHPSSGKTPVSDDKVDVSSAPRIPDKELPCTLLGPSPSRPHPLSQFTLPPISPPLTPLADSSDATLVAEPSPAQPMTIVPPSPYDPLLTPSFRHSPPRLPSDQPWRFPSPSHPLHSSAQELCLTMLAPNGISPVSKGHSVTGTSPGSIAPGTTLQSPTIIAFGRHKTYNLDPDTPESMEKISRPSPRTLFLKGRLPLPVTDRINPDHHRRLINESPISRNSRRTARSRKKRPVSESSDDWLSSGSPSSASRLAEVDPFAVIYNSWGSESLQKTYGSPISSLGADSPVLRSNVLPFSGGSVGLGIGLLEPFTFPHEDDSDLDCMLMYPAPNEEDGDEAEVAKVLAVSDDEREVGRMRNKRRRTVV